MSWYYAGTDAKPVGPVTFEELHARRASGVVVPETYVIEHAGEAGAIGSWRRYGEMFPASVPPSPLPPLPVNVPPVLLPAPPAPHPLFPSAAAATPPPPAYTPVARAAAAPPAHYVMRRTNGFCAWGFGLAVAGFILSPLCGVGLLLAAPALLLCLVGFVQAGPPQAGRGLAVAGSLLALLGLIISICFLAYFGPMVMKHREDTSSQQNSD